MKMWHLLTFLIMAQLCLAQTSDQYHPARIIVKFSDVGQLGNIDLEKNKFNIPAIDALNSSNRVKSIRPLNSSAGNDTYVMEFTQLEDLPSTIYSYYDTRLFHYVEPDYIGHASGGKVPNDGSYATQWGLNNDGTFQQGGSAKEGADIDMQRAWEVTTGSADVTIAILDTGLKTDHPEFAGRVWMEKGKDFANSDDDPTDDQGHGTGVTSIIAANGDNETGLAGVDWKARILPLKVLDSEKGGYYSWWTEAIYYAVDNGARVINMSLGGAGYSAALEDAINYAADNDAIVVASMMNFNNDDVYYPSAFANTIAVGSTNSDDSRTDQFAMNEGSGSNYGAYIDVTAPGNYIYGASYLEDDSYDNFWSGTSQAAPHVTGVVSLLLSLDPDLTLESVRSIITNSAEDQVGKPSEDTPGWDQFHGHGRLNAYEALNSLTTSVDEVTASGSFQISPNPIAKGDYLHISFFARGVKVLTIYDSAGQLIMMNKTSEEEFFLNSANLESGTYIVKVQSGEARVSSSKFVIK